MKKEMSEHARTAKAIRAVIKSHGLKGKVTCSSYSMGSSVHADVINATKEQKEAITKETDKFSYGHFDGMTDMYENSNMRDDIPQVKHLIIQFEYSQDVLERAWALCHEKLGNFEDAPKDVNDSYRYFWVNNQSAYQLIIEAIHGEFGPFTI